jgi:hypothetical protein
MKAGIPVASIGAGAAAAGGGGGGGGGSLSAKAGAIISKPQTIRATVMPDVFIHQSPAFCATLA